MLENSRGQRRLWVNMGKCKSCMGLIGGWPLKTSAASSVRGTTSVPRELWWSSVKVLCKLAKNGESCEKPKHRLQSLIFGRGRPSRYKVENGIFQPREPCWKWGEVISYISTNWFSAPYLNVLNTNSNQKVISHKQLSTVKPTRMVCS